MSIARLHTVTHCRKAQGKCPKCDKPIKKGDGYRWWKIGFRARFKHTRCLACPAPRESERESNGSMSMIYQANEALEDALFAATTSDDVKSAVDDAANGVREAIDDWEEKKSNLEQAFPGGCPAIEDIDEKVGEAESLADALEAFEVEETDEESEDEDDPAAPDIESWREQALSCWSDNFNL